jgi:outer membrane protein, multidrug efflux system
MSSPPTSMPLASRIVFAAALCLLSACAHQVPRAPASFSLPAAWDEPPDRLVGPTIAPGAPPAWWMPTADAAIVSFIAAAEAGHPSVDAALARIDEARAGMARESAAGKPTLAFNASGARARSQGDSGDTGAVLGRAASVGLSLGWELDLAGRIRAATNAARQRLASQEADANNTRLMLTHDVVASALSLRGCRASVRLQQASAASRSATLEVLRGRVQAGLIAKVDMDREAGRMALAQVDLAAQREACAQLTHQLVTLTGLSPAQIRQRLDDTEPPHGDEALAQSLDAWPRTTMPLPATVLLKHPSVVFATREMEAAWIDIAQARASRWPRLSLEAQLSRQWLNAAGTGQWFTPWSIGPALVATLLDGGAGRARVSAAQARYRGAVARVELSLRQAVEDIENGLAAAAFANQRASASLDSLAAAREVWRVTRARHNSGQLSHLELEDARRQFLAAQLAAVAAARDRSLAWAALVRASGHAGLLQQDNA